MFAKRIWNFEWARIKRAYYFVDERDATWNEYF